MLSLKFHFTSNPELQLLFSLRLVNLKQISVLIHVQDIEKAVQSVLSQ